MPPAADTSRDDREIAVAIAVAMLVAAALGAGALGHRFPNDDEFIVQRALDLRSPAALPHALARSWWPDALALWRPVTTLQFAVETWIGGGAAWVYHAGNVVWHTLATALVARLAGRFGGVWAALVAGLWFAVLPVHVEAVAAIVGRADIAATVFLVLLAWVASGDQPAHDFPRAAARTAVLAALALGSKESGIVAPAIVWAAARLRHGGAPSLALAAAAGAGLVPLLLGRLAVLGTFGGDVPHPTWHAVTGWPAYALAFRFLAVGASHLVWPRVPRFEYAPPESLAFHPEPALVLAGVLLAALVVAASARQFVAPAVSGLLLVWWGATILPVSNLVFRSGIVLADRTQYAPSVAVAVGLGLVVATVRDRRGVGAARAMLALLAPLVALGALRTREAMPHWYDSRTVISAFVARAPESWPGYLFRGRAYLSEGRRDDAKADFERGIALFGREGRLLFERARLAVGDGDTTLAVSLLDRSIAVAPRPLRPRQVLLDLRRARGDTADVCRLLLDGLALNPDQRRWTAELAERRATGQCPPPEPPPTPNRD